MPRTLEEMAAQGEELLKQPIDLGPPTHYCDACGNLVRARYFEQRDVGFLYCENCEALLSDEDEIEGKDHE